MAVESSRFSGARGVVALAVVTLLAALFLFAVAEGAVRIRQWMKHGTVAAYDALYVVDAKSGLRVPRAGYRSERIRINALGFRGPELDMPKPPGRIRIAFLGASTTFCGEVSSDAAVWTEGVVAHLRRAFPEATFDFVNAGVPGYSLESSLLHYRAFVKATQPDAVMVYHATNGMSFELRNLAKAQGLWRDDAEMQSPRARYSLLWDLVEKNLRVKLAGGKIDSGAARLSVDAAALGTDFARELRMLLDEAAASSRHVSVATFSTRLRREQGHEERKAAAVSALVYMPFMGLDGLIDGYERYNAVIRAVASESRSLLIDGEHAIPGDAAHFVDTVHFTDRGSAAMAERVAGALARDPAFRTIVQGASKADRPAAQ